VNTRPDTSDYSSVESIENSIIDMLFSSGDSAFSSDNQDESYLSLSSDYDGVKCYRSSINNLGRNSNSDNNRLLKSYNQSQDQKVFDLLAEGNLHLAVRIASVLVQAYPQIDEQDLISEGFFGLERAINSYSTGYNSSFAAYASLAILRAMQRYIALNLNVVSHPTGWFNKMLLFSKYLDDNGISSIDMLTKKEREDIKVQFRLSERSLSSFLSTYPYEEYNLSTSCIKERGKMNSLLTNIICNSYCFHPSEIPFMNDEQPKYQAGLSYRDTLRSPTFDLKNVICDILEDEMIPLSIQEIMNELKRRYPLNVFSEEQVKHTLGSPLFAPISTKEMTLWIYCDYVRERKEEFSRPQSQDNHIDYGEVSLAALRSLLKEEDDSKSVAEDGFEELDDDSEEPDKSFDNEDDYSNNDNVDDIIKMIFG